MAKWNTEHVELYREYRSMGCHGGYPHETLVFGMSNFLALKQNYPYVGVRSLWQRCKQYGDWPVPMDHFEPSIWHKAKNLLTGESNQINLPKEVKKVTMQMLTANQLVRVDTFRRVNNSFDEIKKALQIGPLIAMVDGGSDYFTFYRGGIIPTKRCGRKSNHVVLIVGYGRHKPKRFIAGREHIDYLIV